MLVLMFIALQSTRLMLPEETMVSKQIEVPGQPVGTDGETATRESGADSKSVTRSGWQEGRGVKSISTTDPVQISFQEEDNDETKTDTTEATIQAVEPQAVVEVCDYTPAGNVVVEEERLIQPLPTPNVITCLGHLLWVGETVTTWFAVELPDEQKPDEPVVIGRVMQLTAYTADWCSGCKVMKSTWERLKAEGFLVTIVDIDDPPHWANDYRPAQIPLTVLHDGKEFQCQWVGYVSIEELRTSLHYGEGVLPSTLGEVLDSPRSPVLDEAAMESAKLQAERNEQGHHDWAQRRSKIVATSGYASIEEICAESWPEQRDADDETLWTEAFISWKQSPGHWRIANTRWRAYGRARAQGSNGIWYFVVLAASNERTLSVQKPTFNNEVEASPESKKGDDGEPDQTQSESACTDGPCYTRRR